MSKPFIFRAWFIRQLRRASYRYPPFYEVEKKARREFYIDSKHGKKLKRVEYQCAECSQWFNKKGINKDHIVPVIDPAVGFPILSNGEDDWNTYIKRMLMHAEIQMLCKACHNVKTQAENVDRRKTAKTKKAKKGII